MIDNNDFDDKNVSSSSHVKSTSNNSNNKNNNGKSKVNGKSSSEDYELSQFDFILDTRNNIRNNFSTTTSSTKNNEKNNNIKDISSMDLYSNALFKTNNSNNKNNEYDINNIDLNASGDVVKGLDDQIIYLELNDLNQQTSMSNVIRVIQRMHTLFSTKWNDSGELNMPRWLDECKEKMTDVRTTNHRNIRLFMLRLLINQPVADIVRLWIENLFPCILDTVLNDLCVTSSSKESITISYAMLCLLFVKHDIW
jgi:hypothetical protein